MDLENYLVNEYIEDPDSYIHSLKDRNSWHKWNMTSLQNLTVVFIRVNDPRILQCIYDYLKWLRENNRLAEQFRLLLDVLEENESVFRDA